jgi:proline iminopeptidase
MLGFSMLQKLATGTAIFLVTALTACSPMATEASTVIPPITGLQAVNGTALYYEIIGKGAPLFVLHGGPGNSHRYFLPYVEALSDEYKLFFYDQRGTGLSDGHLDLAAISIEQFVEDLEALRVAFALEKISVMGHSWGAIIALAYALKYQAHLDHLILVDSTPVNDTFLIEFSETLQQRIQGLSADAQHELTTTCTRPSEELSPEAIDECNQLEAQLKFYDPTKAATVDWAMEENTLKNSATVRALITASFKRIQHDIDAQLSTVRVQTLIIHGDFDLIPLESSEYLHQHIPGSQIVPISQSGHFPFIEQPEQFIAALRAFLSK